MPRLLKLCAVPGCPEHVERGRCARHARELQRLVDRRRGGRQERGYTDKWARYSRAFLSAHPVCADPFGVHGPDGWPAEVTDHIIPPIYGGEFWNPANHQPLCVRCNSRKAREDARKYGSKGGVLNSGHPTGVPSHGPRAHGRNVEVGVAP